MSELGMGQNMTLVDTGAMRETSATMRKRLEKIGTAQNELKKCCQLMLSIWEGAASESYGVAYQKALYYLNMAFKAYERLPNKLDGLADEYDLAHGIAVQIASGIEKPVWADVSSYAPDSLT